MKHRWMVLVFCAALGCRSSQPPTNPFLRTTVPPPGTGAAVVTPGEPYYPGAPPAVAAPAAAAPLGAAPATVAPAAPAFTPPPVVAPPPVAAPPVIPPKDRFSPPGGSFQYNQSSNERRKSIAPSEDDGGEEALAENQPAKKPIVLPRGLSQARQVPKDAVQTAMHLSLDQDDFVAASYSEMSPRQASKSPATSKRSSPALKLQVEAGPDAENTQVASARNSSVRIVGDSAASGQRTADTTRPREPAMRVTLGDPIAQSVGFRDVTRTGVENEESRLQIASGINLASDDDIPDAQ